MAGCTLARGFTVSSDAILIEHRGGSIVADGHHMQPVFFDAPTEQIGELLTILRKLGNIDDIVNQKLLPFDLVGQLITAGILQTSSDRSGLSSPFREKRSINDKPEQISLFLILNQYCNLKCVYCLEGQESYEYKARRAMSPHLAKRSIEKFYDLLNEGGGLGITFFGGEPLLSWPTIREILTFCEQVQAADKFGRTINFAIQTNLSFLPKDFIDLVTRHQIAIVIDIDGPRDIQNKLRPMKGRISDSFGKTTNNLKKLADAEVRFHLRATLTSENVNYLAEVEALHSALGTKNATELGLLRPVNSDGFVFPVNLIPSFNDIARAIDEGLERRSELFHQRAAYYAELASEPLNGEFGCNASFGLLPTIAYNGAIYPCTWFVGNRNLEIGHIDAAPMISAEALKRVEDLMHINNDPVCSDCNYRHICGGGCAVTRVLTKFGTISLEGKVALESSRSMQCAFTKTLTNYVLRHSIDQIRETPAS